MTAVLLSAGKATRLGLRAPRGCKAMLRVGGVTMLDHWRERFPDLIVVVRPEHDELIPDDVHRVRTDDERGPVGALAAALPHCAQEPVTVIYADTYLTGPLPDADEWCAVAAAKGGRSWYVAECGMLAYRAVAEDEVALVGVGLFRFAEKWRLELAVSAELGVATGEIGMDAIVNDLDVPFEPVRGWQDVGTEDAIRTWRAA